MSALARPTAADIRAEWQGWALSTLPADRPAAEAAISELYALIGQDPPRFVWVDSPAAALKLVPKGIPLRHGPGWSVPQLLAHSAATLRKALDRRLGQLRVREDPLNAEVRDPLRDLVWDGICTQVRLALPLTDVLTWYGQHETHWIAHYDAWRRIGGRTYRELDWQLDLWAALTRSCGWWWPLDDRCVISERPVSVRVEDRVLHSATGPAITWADGWSVHSWRGLRVPGWVITGPTPELIGQEPNIEVRRCAIERIGWDSYITQAGLELIGVAPDPGNPGFDLHLYDLPGKVMGRPARVLLAVNGSLERDGQRRRYGLGVPGHLDDPVAAAAWTYGLSADHYSQLARRT